MYKEGVSTELLGTIEANECFAEATLSRSRFRRLFNEIEKEQARANGFEATYRAAGKLVEMAGFPAMIAAAARLDKHTAQALIHNAACECMAPDQMDKYEALFVGADDLPLRFLRCVLKRIDRAILAKASSC